jgi:hypothetical protein
LFLLVEVLVVLRVRVTVALVVPVEDRLEGALRVPVILHPQHPLRVTVVLLALETLVEAAVAPDLQLLDKQEDLVHPLH